MSDLAKNVILWVVIAIVLVSVFQNFGITTPDVSEKDYSTFLDEVRTPLSLVAAALTELCRRVVEA